MVQDYPDGLFGGEVGVARPGPEACDGEAAVEVCLKEFVVGGDFGGFLVGLFSLLEVWRRVLVIELGMKGVWLL